jgi:hypothetical protein
MRAFGIGGINRHRSDQEETQDARTQACQTARSDLRHSVSADLNQALSQYAEMYRSAYGEAEPVAELIPFMLAAFLESDRAFARARKNGVPDGADPVVAVRHPDAALKRSIKLVFLAANCEAFLIYVRQDSEYPIRI